MEYRITHHILCPKHPQHVFTKDELEALADEREYNEDYMLLCVCNSLVVYYKLIEKAKIPLPAKLSDLIELAVKDLEQVERMPETYVVNMSSWHSPNSHCKVCFAGAVIARTGGLDPTLCVTPEFFGDDAHKLGSLDHMRYGDYSLAYQAFYNGKPVPKAVREMSIKIPLQDSYEYEPEDFKKTMLQVAAEFRRLGY